MRKWMTLLLVLSMLIGTHAAAGEEIALHAAMQRAEDSPAWVAALPQARDAAQLFVVAGLSISASTRKERPAGAPPFSSIALAR